MTLSTYLQEIARKFQTGQAREHSYRGLLERLLLTLTAEEEIRVINEPAQIACGAPDYVLNKDTIPVGYIEAKDIGDKDLHGKKANKIQFSRYKEALENIIFTDYLHFLHYKNGELVYEVQLAKLEENTIVPLPENFAAFEAFVRNFVQERPQSLSDADQLAQMMASKAKMIKEVIFNAVHDEKSSLREQLISFQRMLVKDMTEAGFADVYAQTIAYGLFAARFHDPTLPTFSRMEAAQLLPKSNPFLRKLFQYIAGFDVDERILWVIDDLIEIFRASDVKGILAEFGSTTGQQDPILHFYENFLALYDSKLRKVRGVWYTPEPVVNFMVRTVDEILKKDFNIEKGLADNQKIEHRGKTFHKVQVLDPATGTGTFLAEIIKYIYGTQFKNVQGAWGEYVKNDLIPRLNGFELMMASYAIAHLKLDMILTETGFQNTDNERLNIYLTNSLEEPPTGLEAQFAQWLSAESEGASRIKKDTPVMVIIGNPPYSAESQNKGPWIEELMQDYKKEPGGKKRLQERNPKWINDDYVKFLRYGQHLIEKNGSGVLAFINPHGFLDNPTFRGMRWQLLKTYDKIYTIDLHGNSKKRETTPEGGKDDNVFDIQQGVSINLFVKTGQKKEGEFAQVFHHDLYGRRKEKYNFLLGHDLNTVPYAELPHKAPMYFMTPKDFALEAAYEKGFSIAELFPVNSVGIVTARDAFTLHETKELAQKTIEKFLSLDNEHARTHFQLGEDKRDWQVGYARKDLLENYAIGSGQFVKVAYRPFEEKWTFYTGKSKGFHCMPRHNVMQHFLGKENWGIITVRRIKLGNHLGFFITDKPSDDALSGMSSSVVCPLYLYPERKKESSEEQRQLEAKLEEAQILYEGFAEAFKKAEKTYRSITQPDADFQRYYSEQLKLKKKLEGKIHHYKEALATFEKNNLFAEEKPETRKPNLNPKIVTEIAQRLGIKFTSEKETSKNTFAPIDVLDYIYAVLHSPSYRETYKAFLKIDFPRVPYPKNQTQFWALVHLGSQLRSLHLLENSAALEKNNVPYPQEGNNEVTRKMTKSSPGFVPTKSDKGQVFINDQQYFENVPEAAWNFYIGGYQPAQKWLKDRFGKTLNLSEVQHYQKIITALTETERLMGEVDIVLYPK